MIPSEERPTSTSSRTPRPRRILLSNLQIILVVLTVIGLRLMIDFSQRIVEGQQKVAEQRALEAEIDALLEEQQELEAAKTYYSSAFFIEVWAHNEGKMVRDGERLVIPIYENAAESPGQGAAEHENSTPIPTWQVWWTLFFDGPPPSLLIPGS